MKILRYTPSFPLAKKGEPSLEVFSVRRHVDRAGHHVAPPTYDRIRVPIDQAADLADEASAWACPVAGDCRGDSEWMVGAVGFTEAEAVAACEAATRELSGDRGTIET